MTARFANPGFLVELQSLRGLAALVVLWRHTSSAVWPGDQYGGLVRILNADAAVIFFFTLSGVVLTFQLTKRPVRTAADYADYLLRRFFRIVPLLFVTALAAAMICNFLLSHEPKAFATPWFNGSYTRDIGWRDLVPSFVGYGTIPNPAFWSIFVELMGSIFLPLFVVGANRPSFAVAFGIVLTIAAIWLVDFPGHAWPIYLIAFYAGVIVARTEPSTGRILRQLARPVLWAGIAVAGLVVVFNRHVHPAAFHGDPINNLLELSAVTFLLAVVLAFRGHVPWLLYRPFRTAGDLSYGVYLWHFPVIAALVAGLQWVVGDETILRHNLLVLPVLMTAVTALSLLLAAVTYRVVELQGNELGKKVADYMFGRGRKKADIII